MIAAVLAPAFIFLLPTHQPRPSETLWNKLRRMDWLGIVLIAAVYTTYTLALTFGGTQWAWDNYRFIVTIIICGLTLAAFVSTSPLSTGLPYCHCRTNRHGSNEDHLSLMKMPLGGFGRSPTLSFFAGGINMELARVLVLICELVC